MSVAVCAVGLEVVCLLLLSAALFSLAEIESIEHAPYGLRALGAVATAGLYVFTGGAAAFVALRAGHQWLAGKLLGAIFIVAVFNGVALYFLLIVANLLNEFLWDIPFPLGGESDFR